MNPVFKSTLTVVVAASTAWSVFADNWPQWRGPNFNGSSAEKHLPTEWSQTNNVAWVAAIPGRSGSTPVIWEDSVFISTPDKEKNLVLLCLERKTGKARWKKVVAAGDREKGRNNMASPSPATDGKVVFVMFATGDLAAFDFSGAELWKRNLGKEYGRLANMWIYGSSPMVYKERLYIQALQRSPVPPDYTHAVDDKPERESYLLCLEPKTGKNIWRQVRATDAQKEAMEAYSTPIPFEGEQGTEIIVVGGNYTTAHRADNGEEIWRCGGLNDRNEPFWRIVPSPVTGQGMVFVSGPKRDPLLAIKDGGKGTVTATHLAWKFKENPTDCATPLFYENKLFVLDGDRQVITCFEPRTGEKKWQGNLGVREIFRGSPAGADGKIYCISENGTVVVLSAGGEFKILSTVSMGEEPIRSSIAIAHGHLFIRTAENLYCIGPREQ